MASATAATKANTAGALVMGDSQLRALHRDRLDSPERYVASARRLGPEQHYQALQDVRWVTEAQAKVLAWCSDRAAQSVVPCWMSTSRGEWHNYVRCEKFRAQSGGWCWWELPRWIPDLILLLGDLPDPKGRGWECDLFAHHAVIARPCPACKQTGHRSPTSNERRHWYSTLIARDIARACHIDCLPCDAGWSTDGITPKCLVAVTLDAISTWLDVPTEANGLAWNNAWVSCTSFEWLPPVWTGHVWILAGSRLGVDIRAVALEALRPFCGRWEV